MSARSLRDVAALLRRQRYAVLATARADGMPQAAVIGVAVAEPLDLVFDTFMSSRKYMNLVHDDRVALTAWEGAVTVQIEGRAAVPAGQERERAKVVYFDAFPDGRERELVSGIVWVTIRPTWVRWSDFSTTPPTIEVIPPPEV